MSGGSCTRPSSFAAPLYVLLLQQPTLLASSVVVGKEQLLKGYARAILGLDTWPGGYVLQARHVRGAENNRLRTFGNVVRCQVRT